MARLPTPGGDKGNWGDILNDFLKATHNDDGTLKDNAVTAAALGDNTIATATIQDNAVSTAKIQNGAITPAKLTSDVPATGEFLGYNGTGFEWGIPAGGAGTSDHGALLGLADDDHPQYHTDVRGDARYYTQAQVDSALAGKSDTTHTHAIADVTNLQTSLNDKANNTTSVTGTGSVTGGGDLSASRTLSLVNDSATPGTSKYYGTDGTGTKGFYDVPAATGDPSLGGDLSGTASNAQIAAGAIVNADINNAAAIEQSKVANLTTDLANKANATHTHAAVDISSGVVATARLGSGTADTTTFLRGDGTWATPVNSGGGQTVVSRSANTTAAAGEYILADAATAGFTVTLPDGQPNGTIISVKKVDVSVNAVLIVAQTGQIEGNASIVANQQWESWDFITDGTSWYRT